MNKRESIGVAVVVVSFSIVFGLLGYSIGSGVLDTPVLPSERKTIENELKEHLKSNSEKIILKDIIVIEKEMDETWTCRVNCLNRDMGLFFYMSFSFNPETKELIGYNVLEYEM